MKSILGGDVNITTQVSLHQSREHEIRTFSFRTFLNDMSYQYSLGKAKAGKKISRIKV